MPSCDWPSCVGAVEGRPHHHGARSFIDRRDVRAIQATRELREDNIHPAELLAEKLLEAPKELILTALELEQSDGAVIADRVGDTACTFLAGLYRAEQAIADRLIRIVNGKLPWAWIDEEKAIPWIERRSGLQLADSQRAAIRLALMAKALVITGGPGVGKTTIVNSILKILAAKGVRLLLCAPTGRAAKRMTEATGVEAKTIHRLLEVDPKSGTSRLFRASTSLFSSASIAIGFI